MRLTASHPALLAHREAGGRALYVSDGELVRAHGDKEVDRLHLQRDLSDAAAALPAEVLLASVGAAWALGLDPQFIRTGLDTYGTEQARAIVIA